MFVRGWGEKGIGNDCLMDAKLPFGVIKLSGTIQFQLHVVYNEGQVYIVNVIIPTEFYFKMITVMNVI